LSLSGPAYFVGAELGEQHGANLFHSFSAFNLSAQESAVFGGPREIAHIVGRVTGDSPSLIAGTLRTEIPGAQLWLFNPAGMEYTGISEVPGGVATARAVSLSLKDGGMFRADEPANSVLTIAPPQVFFLAPEAPPLDEAVLYQAKPESELVLPFSVGRDQGSRILEQPAICGQGRDFEISRLGISYYRGTPLSPDDWQASGLLPLDFEPVPADDCPPGRDCRPLL
jgi:filamentous hemagglutinin family protein